MIKDMLLTYKKTVGLVILLIVLVALSLGIYAVFTRYGKTAVRLDILPNSADITINNTPYRSTSTLYLKPGSYSYIISHEGFETRKGTLEVGVDSLSLAVMLVPIHDTAIQWVKQNQQLIIAFESRAGAESAKESEQTLRTYPILGALPYRSPLFVIGNRFEGDSLILTVRSEEQYRHTAINQIRQWGYQPSTFRYEFIDEENPFIL